MPTNQKAGLERSRRARFLGLQILGEMRMSNDSKPASHVETLIKKAAEAQTALEAQAFAEAAAHAASAMYTLRTALKH